MYQSLLFTSYAHARSHVHHQKLGSRGNKKPAEVSVHFESLPVVLILVYLGGRNNTLAKTTRGWQDFEQDLANVASYNAKLCAILQ